VRKSDIVIILLLGALIFLVVRSCGYRSRVAELEQAVVEAEQAAMESEALYQRGAQVVLELSKEFEEERSFLREKLFELEKSRTELENRYRKLKAEVAEVRDDEVVHRIAQFVGDTNVWKDKRAFCLTREGAERSLSIFYDRQMLEEKAKILVRTLEAERQVSESYKKELDASRRLLSLCNEKAVRWKRAYEASGKLIGELQRIRLKERWTDRGGGFLLGVVAAVSVYLVLR